MILTVEKKEKYPCPVKMAHACGAVLCWTGACRRDHALSCPIASCLDWDVHFV